jgi:hypothetical protein
VREQSGFPRVLHVLKNSSPQPQKTRAVFKGNPTEEITLLFQMSKDMGGGEGVGGWGEKKVIVLYFAEGEKYNIVRAMKREIFRLKWRNSIFSAQLLNIYLF